MGPTVSGAFLQEVNAARKHNADIINSSYAADENKELEQLEENNEDIEDEIFSDFEVDDSTPAKKTKSRQEIVDSMLDAVDKYAILPPEIEDKIKEGSSGRNSSILNSTSPTDLEDAANRIKNCYSSCE